MYSRLNTVGRGPRGRGSWCSGSLTQGEWIQVDLLEAKRIREIATQGRSGWTQWVTKYQLKYSLTSDEDSFQYVTSPDDDVTPMTFDANTDYESVVMNSFEPVTARYVRLYPTEWYSHISLRWEVYACSTGV